MDSQVQLPPLQLAVRTDQGCTFYIGPPTVKAVDKPAVPASQIFYSQDGSLLIAAHAEATDIYNSFTLEKVGSVPTTNVAFLDISRSGRYLSTCEKMPRDDSEFRNLKLWDLYNLQEGPVIAYRSKNVSVETWPVFQFSEDERALVHMGPNTVNIHNAEDNFKSAVQKLPMKGLGGFSLSPCDQAPFVAVFVPEAKGQPASVSVFHVPSIPQSGLQPMPAAVARRSMYRTQGMRFFWNSSGSALLVVAYQDVDATNQSYYGEQKLHFLSTDGKIEQIVPDLKEGPIHDVQWSPKGEHFLVVCGFMPAKTILFDSKCKPIYNIGSGPVNTVRWNPQGRFFVVAGFGNLPGDMTFYDKKANGKCFVMGKVRSTSVDCVWSPCGRFLLTKIVAPRLRVDNSFKIFTYYGEQVHLESFPVLLDARWRPAQDGVFPDLPADQEHVQQQQQQQKASQQQGESSGSYVPPHLRNKMGGGSSSSKTQFSLAYDPDDQAGKVKQVFQNRQNARSTVPGEEYATQSLSKSAKKRQNKKKNAEATQDTEQTVVQSTQQMSNVQLTSSSTNQATSSQQHGLTDGMQPQEMDVQKRIKNLQKKYRQIQQLKEKLETQGKDSLEPEQIAKIATEQSVVQEIQSLGGSL
eukprot:TRINITY_DN7554_c0_g1_i1.p1 TRINITY_DN7554_c0_g1~~TRINITY_DN7554_c0_g1_i1.p1  ORF type:complete len:634 (+),score=76.72 TRINITY_DN7554_c0_g1_i1:142-2043(+)